jgi:hypothetical protein
VTESSDGTLFVPITDEEPFVVWAIDAANTYISNVTEENASLMAEEYPGTNFFFAELSTENHREQSNLVDHARRELEIIGEEPETIEGYLKVIQAFADMDHSGGSASIAIPVINELLQFNNLGPLTDNPDEWMAISEEMGFDNAWQSRRRSDAFSHDGGKTYYLLSEGAHQNNPSPLHESKPHKE